MPRATFELPSAVGLWLVGEAIADVRGFFSELKAASSRLRSPALIASFAAMGVLGLAHLLRGEDTGALYVLAALIGMAFIHSRVLPSLIWAAVLVQAFVGFAAGDSSDLLVILLTSGALALASLHTPPPLEASGSQNEAAFTQTPEGVEADETSHLRGSASELPLLVSTVGRLSVRARERELGPLLERPLPIFIWLYLLCRYLRFGEDGLSRSQLADEISPGLDPSEQRRRLRSQLYDLQRGLPSELASQVAAGGQMIQFRTEGMQVDIQRLRELARESQGGQGLVSPGLMARLEAAVQQLASGEFLPFWDELERKINGGRGISGQLVRDLRTETQELRVKLALAAAASHRLRGNAAGAVALLEPVARERQEEGVLRGLLAAYFESGQHAKATSFRDTYGLKEEL